MKCGLLVKLGLLAMLCLLFSPANAQRAPARKPTPKAPEALVDAYFGFRDIRLESDISSHPEMEPQLVKDAADSALVAMGKINYTRKGDDPMIGPIKTTLILYCYYSKKLASVVVFVDGYIDRLKLLAAMKAKYGSPVQAPDAEYAEDPEAESFVWLGKRASVFLSKMDENGITVMMLQSKALKAKEEADDKRRASAGL